MAQRLIVPPLATLTERSYLDERRHAARRGGVRSARLWSEGFRKIAQPGDGPEDDRGEEQAMQGERKGNGANGAPQEAAAGRVLLTAGEVAELLGVPVGWVYEQSRAGRLPTVALGRYRRFRRAAIEAWIEELEAKSRGAGGLSARRINGAGPRRVA